MKDELDILLDEIESSVNELQKEIEERESTEESIKSEEIPQLSEPVNFEEIIRNLENHRKKFKETINSGFNRLDKMAEEVEKLNMDLKAMKI
jgi:chromosome segregation ATPase